MLSAVSRLLVLFCDFLISSVPHRLGMGSWGEGFSGLFHVLLVVLFCLYLVSHTDIICCIILHFILMRLYTFLYAERF